MNGRWWLLASVLGLCCMTGGRTVAETVKKPNSSRWLSDFDEGRKVAKQTGKPLFIVFRCEH